ncbi:NADH:ubiquinone oxidoreductase [Geomonas paludis]|uniref:Cytosolic NiFe-hydrogenase subunit delta n=1 Tax=Geomonas paludis TaxID=2740185 RepID=A0A6V8MVE3_9BACT|nr:NADH:ubiquinone oxidoreductase [Geomonas paludis]UPU34179.1 NADH:ubiquinone oxidoreductase [Geomonas paludis]GFO64155.1 cytosolic NiFe-hydrogenase subunit delta [Geomonas paludis]
MRPMKIAITGLTACSGCQLTLLNCEDQLPDLLARCELVYFPLAESGNTLEVKFDAAIVEGAVSTPKDLELLFQLRNASTHLVAYGTCALFGGVAAMNNRTSCRQDLLHTVFGAAEKLPESFAPAPLANYVSVDAAVTGCPPEKQEIAELVAALAAGTLPPPRSYPVCTECRSRENLCLLLEKKELCLGPVVQGGCNARCPATGIVCEGCRGPVREANVAQELELLLERGFGRDEIERRMSRFKPEWDYGQRR